MKLSAQQQAVVEAVAANDTDIQVTALAGCGKTTTILEATKSAVGSVAFFAFNKAIAAELSGRAPSHVQVQTIHSLGFAAIRRAFRSVKVDADKTHQLVMPFVNEADRRGDFKTQAARGEAITAIKKLVGLVKNTLTRPTVDGLTDLCDEYEIDPNGATAFVFDVVAKVICLSIPAEDATTCTVDFDDMIWIPEACGLNTPTFDWVFVDEAQDLNGAQKALILKTIRRGGRVCFVGDPNQAIYAFRGADSSAMYTLSATLVEMGRRVVELPLTQTRRCPRAIVALAQSFVPSFEAMAEAPEGVVRYASTLEAKIGDMVLCRKNAPLVPQAYRLLRMGLPARIQGRDIGAGLTALVTKTKATTIPALLTALEAYSAKEGAKIAARFAKKPSKLEEATNALTDKVETVVFLAAEQNTIADLLDAIQRLFVQVDSATGVVLLSSIHKAKGLEAECVHILETKRMPGSQEDNLRYVAITRAKQELVFVPEPVAAGLALVA